MDTDLEAMSREQLVAGSAVRVERGMPRPRYVPRPPLSDHIEFFWAFDAYGGSHARERVLPSATSELVVTLSDGRSDPVVCGAHAEFFMIDTGTPQSLLGVHFRPGGAVPFLKRPAHELVNTRVTLDALWGRAASELRERLHEARTWEARFRVLEDVLCGHLAGSPPRHPAVTFALDAMQTAPHARTIGQLTERIGLSSRRFIEVFAAEVGLTPKLFCRVRRFQRVLALIERDEAIAWTEVVLACGYYDQAHFIHEFRAFSGTNPTGYLRVRGPQRNHIPLSARDAPAAEGRVNFFQDAGFRVPQSGHHDNT
jgi:AraC-like DNA-binding protein